MNMNKCHCVLVFNLNLINKVEGYKWKNQTSYHDASTWSVYRQLFSSCGLLLHSFCSGSVQWHRGLIALWELIRWVIMYFRVCNTHSFYVHFDPPHGCQGKLYWPHRVYEGCNMDVRRASAPASQYRWCFCDKVSVNNRLTLYTRFSHLRLVCYFTYEFAVFMVHEASASCWNINKSWFIWSFCSHVVTHSYILMLTY